MKQSVAVAMITHCAVNHLPHSLPFYLNSPMRPRVIVVNSSSEDGTVELAQKMGAETFIVPRSEFNHGATRELIRKHLGTDIVVMVTPDAYPLHNQLVETLVAPIIDGNAAVSYARQIPHDGAEVLESFPRHFNYPMKSEIRSLNDLKQYGVYTFFCSNTCAAYSNKALDTVGGFCPTLFGEDTMAVAKLLHQDYRIAYESKAVVKHSHKYNLKQEFCRHFDIGLVRKKQLKLLDVAGNDSARGMMFSKSLLAHLYTEAPWLIPYACLHLGAKWSGYQIGRCCVGAPIWLKRFFSSQDFYWNSIYAKDVSL